jgi:hypothetical protein
MNDQHLNVPWVLGAIVAIAAIAVGLGFIGAVLWQIFRPRRRS